MSADGPDSVPTSADPRSHRPTKRRALTPSSSQAASVDALFAKPDQEIRLPPSSTSALTTAHKGSAPPEIVTNVQGSSAGAGSGEFHVYKAARRREYERLREMDEEVRKEKDAEVFAKERSEREKRDDERTRKNREKREKMKARKAKKGKGSGNGNANGNGNGGAAQEEDKKMENGDVVKAKIAPRKAVEEKEENGEGEDTSKGPSAARPAGLVIHDDD